MVERTPDKGEVVGSIPTMPTKRRGEWSAIEGGTSVSPIEGKGWVPE